MAEVFHGIAFEEKPSSTPSIQSQSTSTIAAVVTSEVVEPGLYFVKSDREALDVFGIPKDPKNKKSLKVLSKSDSPYTAGKTLSAIYKQTSAKVIVSVVAAGTPTPPPADNTTDSDKDKDKDTKAATKEVNTDFIVPLVDDFKKALDELRLAATRFYYRPNIIVAPEFSSIPEFEELMGEAADKNRAICVVDVPKVKKDRQEELTTFVEKAISKSSRKYLVYPRFDQGSSMGTFAVSAAVAGHIAATDAEAGYYSSPSNRKIKGLVAPEDPIGFDITDPNSDAAELNNLGIATIVRQGGWRLWGNATQYDESDPVDMQYRFLTHRRTMDAIVDAVIASHFWAIDKNITLGLIDQITEAVDTYLRNAKNEGAILYGKSYFPTDVNTVQSIREGKTVFDIDLTFSFPNESMKFRFSITDNGIEELLSEVE